MWFYESHLGGIYTTDRELSFDELYCEDCGDCDSCLGNYDSWKDFIKGINPEYFYYSANYVSEMSGISLDDMDKINPYFVRNCSIASDKYRRYTKEVPEDEGYIGTGDYEIMTEVPGDEEDMLHYAINTFGRIEDMLVKYDVKSLDELEIILYDYKTVIQMRESNDEK